MTKLESHSAVSKEIVRPVDCCGVVSSRWCLSVLVLAMVVKVPAQAQDLTTLYNFGNGPNGYAPVGKLLKVGHKLYGTTLNGGAAQNGGTVFEVSGHGSERVLHSFTGSPDGWSPFSGLVRDTGGNLYGVTNGGGDFDHGMVYKVNKAGELSVLYSFKGYPTDGASPQAGSGLVLDAAGNLYGTTSAGGPGACEINGTIVGCGTAFKLGNTGVETVLHGFVQAANDGLQPLGGVILDSAGNLYGTTYGGGAFGMGTVFKVTAAGVETLLYSFRGTPDGAHPEAGLTWGPGRLYGTTYDGGASDYGTVFELKKTGKETVLYSFTGEGHDGEYPTTAVFRDSTGNLFGTTEGGGGSTSAYCGFFGAGCGIIFELTNTGKERVVHSFTGYPDDGAYPLGDLTGDAAGNLYGTTWLGGENNSGTVFRLSCARNCFR